MHSRTRFWHFLKGVGTTALLSALSASGCVLAPAGLDGERTALERAGSPYEPPVAERSLPVLSEHPDWHELLGRAFSANGDLEVSYFEWKAALERVSIAAGWPDTNLMPEFSFMFSGDNMKAWDRTTVNIGFDPMKSLSWPSKVSKAGELALEDARVAGSRFVAVKFAVQRKVLDGWLELALVEEQERILQERVRLAQLAYDSAAQRSALTGEHRDLLRAQVEQRNAQIELAGLQARARAVRATLNGMLARDADAALGLGSVLPEPRPLPVDDATLLGAAVENNPDLRSLAFAVTARQDALELARLQYIPDFNPFVGFTGSVQQMIGVGVSLPTRLPQIRAGIEEANAMLRRAQAELRQAHFDRRSSFVAALYMLRYSERQSAFLAQEVLPVAEQVLGSARQAHATGKASFLDLIDAQRVLLDVRLSIAESRIERERRLAEIEELAGLDVETLVLRDTQHVAVLRNSEVDRHE